MCVGTFKVDGTCDAKQLNPGIDPATIQLRLTNTSPIKSNSTINSVDLFPNLNWSIATIEPAYESSNTGVTYNPDLSSAPGHIKISGLSPLKPQDTLNISFTVTTFSCGDASWDQSLIWSGSNFGGNTFTIEPAKSVSGTSVACGMIACDITNPQPFLIQPTATTCSQSMTSVECIAGVRGSYNKDGNACGTVPFYVSNFLPNQDQTKRKLHFRWPGEAAAAFNYTINTLDPNPFFAWVEDSNQNPIPISSDALQCIPADQLAEKYLPAPYGTLAMDVNSSKNKLKVNAPASITASPNFAIFIGSEKMLVTDVSNGTWTVTRGYGNTPKAPHFATDPVMSTSLPNIPTNDPAYSSPGTPLYAPGNHAHMCWIARGSNGDSTSFFTDIVDIGDGWGVPR
jgi:hypothetical protein